MSRAIILRRKGRARARFCSPACRDGFLCDRQRGAIYCAIRTDRGSYSAETWSLHNATCAYCNADTGRPMPQPPTWPNAQPEASHAL